jgi:hypothetical protein
MHAECNETPRVLSLGETLSVGGGQENWFVNGNFVRYTVRAQGTVAVVEITYLDASMGPGGGTPPMHGRVQA